MSGVRRGGAVALALAVMGCAPAHAAPARLSLDESPADIRAPEGAGVFGRWTVDGRGLPAYDYTADQRTDRRTERGELHQSRDAWHQVGNEGIVANTFNHGYTQLYSQQRAYQWANRFDPAHDHYAGGFGWLKDGDDVHSTLWLDAAADNTLRRFGIGYAEHRSSTPNVAIRETITAPYGDDPVLIHEITLTNRTRRPRAVTWWEYSDVNPVDTTAKINMGLDAPIYDAAHRRLSVHETGDGHDDKALHIFAQPLAGTPVSGFEADTGTLFGTGDDRRARPRAVKADRATNTLAPASPVGPGRTAFAFRSPVTVPPGRRITLRYVYGLAHPDQMQAIADRAELTPSTFRTTTRRWRDWLPQADLGARRRWLARELQWDAYQVASSSNYEEECGHHIITQGGYYQYGGGQQIAFRDPLQHMLPMIYADPELAREVLRYSFQEQPAVTGVIPYGMLFNCTRFDLGNSDDLDFWLLLSTVEYVLATRDTTFLAERIPYRGGLPGPALATGTAWEHVKLSVFHQENIVGRGPNGQYLIGPTGDWSDLSPAFLGITESSLVTAQLAYVYPRLAEVADLVGDDVFAAQLREKGAGLVSTMKGQWVKDRGWFARGYSGVKQLGTGAIFGEPQPWALLAGVADDRQQRALVGNINRFLTGRNAPANLHGPAKIGSSTSPSEEDPEVTEHAQVYADGVGDKNAVFVGGAWYAINGPLTWALGDLDGKVPDAAAHAWDELERNTLKAHADAYPDAWDGVVNVDDACWSWYSTRPGQCGVGTLILLGDFSGQITHQPAWSLFALLKLTGLNPVKDGYEITPHVPLSRFVLRLPGYGIAQDRRAGILRGYVRAEQDAKVTFRVTPRGGLPERAVVRVNGRRTAFTRDGDTATFTATLRKGAKTDWAVTRLGRAARQGRPAAQP